VIACNPNILEAEAVELQVGGQPRLYSRTRSQKIEPKLSKESCLSLLDINVI
jgi:hypothetical protein